MNDRARILVVAATARELATPDGWHTLQCGVGPVCSGTLIKSRGESCQLISALLAGWGEITARTSYELALVWYVCGD